MNDLIYIAIFEYYDCPLFFIAQENKSYYLYYCMDEDLFLKAKINSYYIARLYKGESVKKILNEFVDNNIGVVLDIKGNCEIQLSDFENVEDYLPEIDFCLEYDYLDGSTINKGYDYKKKFPLLFNNAKISFHLKNLQNDTSIFPADIIGKAISLIRKMAETCMPGSKLVLSPFTSGSFKINCELAGKGDLLEDNLHFDNLICEIERINSINLEQEKVKPDILKDLKQLYEFLDSNKLSAEILSKDNNGLMDFTRKGRYLEQNLKLIEKKNNSVEKTKVSGYLESISIKRNSFTMKLSEEESTEIAGKFDKTLFNKIKRKEIELTILKKINCTLQKNEEGKFVIKEITVSDIDKDDEELR